MSEVGIRDLSELAASAAGSTDAAAAFRSLFEDGPIPGPFGIYRRGTRCRVRISGSEGTRTEPGLSALARYVRDRGLEARYDVIPAWHGQGWLLSNVYVPW